MTARSVRRRAWRRRRPHFWQQPIVSPYLDKLRDRAMPDRCRSIGGGIRLLGPQPSITCPRCGATSYNPNDIREGYCGRCHAYTS